MPKILNVALRMSGGDCASFRAYAVHNELAQPVGDFDDFEAVVRYATINGHTAIAVGPPPVPWE